MPENTFSNVFTVKAVWCMRCADVHKGSLRVSLLVFSPDSLKEMMSTHALLFTPRANTASRAVAPVGLDNQRLSSPEGGGPRKKRGTN